MVHYGPVDDTVRLSIIGKKNVVNSENECCKCGATFSNDQGLGGQMIHCNRYDLLSVPPSRARGRAIVHNASTIDSSSSLCKTTSAPVLPQESKVDNIKINIGSNLHSRYSIQEKFDVIKQGDEILQVMPSPPLTHQRNTSSTIIKTRIFLTNGCYNMEGGVNMRIERRWWQ